LRVAIVLVGLRLWFGTQSLIGSREFQAEGLVDMLLIWTAPANHFLHTHPVLASQLLIVSSLIIDILGVYLLAASVFGRTIRPFLGLLILFSLRQLCQVLCALPPPPDMIWYQPRLPSQLGGHCVPSLLVTYHVANDFFFSGHTALAVYGAVELGRRSRRWIPLAVFIAVFEASVVIVLRAHWTMDVFAGAVTALLVAYAANWLAPFVDRLIAGLVAFCTRLVARIAGSRS
jgi:hypothetical protein